MSTLTPIRSALQQEHPHHATMTPLWRRYRAFTGGLSSEAERRNWLPKGKEVDEQYDLRVKLAETISWSEPAVNRMAGRLTSNVPAAKFLDDSKVPKAMQQRLAAWEKNVDGAGTSMANYWSLILPDILMMGVAGIEVAKPRGNPDADPFLCHWKAEEIWDWGIDEAGRLTYVVLKRTRDDRESWDKPRGFHDYYRVLTRTQGFAYTVNGDKEAEPAQEPWTHDLGIVPFVPAYAFQISAMRGRSYIHQISAADLLTFRLDADQLVSSWIHCNPIMKRWARGKVKDLQIGTDRVQHLDPGHDASTREDIEYVELNATGMEVRERMISRYQASALQAAGIDVSQATVDASGPRSGASIAWSFSTAEEPTLNKFAEGMDGTDTGVREVVLRYMEPQSVVRPLHERAYDGHIVRSRKWTLGSDDEAIQRTIDGKAAVPGSPTLHKALDSSLAQRLMVDRDPEEVDQAMKEIEAVDRTLESANRDPDLTPEEESVR